jgi:hypothetical protein
LKIELILIRTEVLAALLLLAGLRVDENLGMANYATVIGYITWERVRRTASGALLSATAQQQV